MRLYELDIPLLSQVVTWAVLDDQGLARFNERFVNWGSWNQGSWAEEPEAEDWVMAEVPDNDTVVATTDPNICGSAFCIAGQVVAQTNMAFIFTGGGDSAEWCAPRVPLGLDDRGRMRYGPDLNAGRTRISQRASEVLGLTSFEADLLFGGSNSINAVVAYAQQFAEKRGQTLDVEPGILALAERVAGDEYFYDASGYYEDEEIEVLPNPNRYVAPEAPAPIRPLSNQPA